MSRFTGGRVYVCTKISILTKYRCFTDRVGVFFDTHVKNSDRRQSLYMILICGNHTRGSTEILAELTPGIQIQKLGKKIYLVL